MIVLDKPSPPTNLGVEDVFAENCTLTWTDPDDDGGAPVTGYVIAIKEYNDYSWKTLPGVVIDTLHIVKGLQNGNKYKFRVRAKNIYGVSDPVETAAYIRAADPFGRHSPSID